jgi:hypothetical protein
VHLGLVKFEGTGPFYLRAVESAKARVLAETVQLTLYAQIDDTGRRPANRNADDTPCSSGTCRILAAGSAGNLRTVKTAQRHLTSRYGEQILIFNS